MPCNFDLFKRPWWPSFCRFRVHPALVFLEIVLLLSSGAPLLAQVPGPPLLSANGRFLVCSDGRPLFLVCDTGWNLAMNLSRDSVTYYLDQRRAQGFNALTLQAFPAGARPNAYGQEAFARSGELYDPLHPLTTPGNRPDYPAEYDHWDHLDFILDLAGEKGFYVILLPTWGTWITGGKQGTDTTRIIFNPTNAYRYGHWLGNRYHARHHVIWMLGGDQSAVYPARDFRPVIRAMAEGLADGVNGENRPDGQADYRSTLMSYHPQKLAPQSSAWFHGDEWLDFNSIQEWPEKQLPNLAHDYALTPVKPSWLFEGRYEAYHRDPYHSGQWRDWQIRYQAYQTVFAGAFGHTYGHEYVFKFRGNWATDLQAPGARSVQHLTALMSLLSAEEYLRRIPDQRLLASPMGEAGRLVSDFQQATRGDDGRYAMVYTASARPVRIHMQHLKGPLNAHWFNPRTGQWYANGQEVNQMVAFEKNVSTQGVRQFDPPGKPGAGNDWVLVLR